MTLHKIDFSYSIPEWGALEMEIDPSLDYSEKEQLAIDEIECVFPDVDDIQVNRIENV